MIDGGYLRICATKADRHHTPDFIEAISKQCIRENEELYRALYYDCPPFRGEVKLPVSGKKKLIGAQGSDAWLHKLAQKDYFAVRLGVLKFRGFVPKTVPLTKATPSDDDFKPDFEQKGVDMRIGLDMAIYAANRSVDIIALITNDTDCIPAMKHARRSGLQVALIKLPDCRLTPELTEHCDFVINIAWPEGFMNKKAGTQ